MWYFEKVSVQVYAMQWELNILNFKWEFWCIYWWYEKFLFCCNYSMISLAVRVLSWWMKWNEREDKVGYLMRFFWKLRCSNVDEFPTAKWLMNFLKSVSSVKFACFCVCEWWRLVHGWNCGYLRRHEKGVSDVEQKRVLTGRSWIRVVSKITPER